ncbi:MAG: methyltransferase domain-containing protein [Chloroflexota bacterium]|nr:methyltransferase domain-containing protein [Dehalococcoidia bacterium]MDW8254914.1 methyltransferase domain-containing protein [Chloroflexota bacterium]
MLQLLPEDRHWWFASRTRALQAILEPHIAGRSGPLRILDVGCGAGNMAHHLAQYGEVIGFDPHRGALAVARERKCIVVQADAAAFPFPESAFDLVAALDVIEHCDDDFAVLCESQRVLRPGGLVAITVPAFQWLWTYNDTINRHRRRYTAEQLRTRLEEAGFAVRRLTYTNCLIFPLAAPLLLARGRRPTRRLSAPITDGAYQVEMEPASPPVNLILDVIGRLEAVLLRRFDLPVGTGLLAVAERAS